MKDLIRHIEYLLSRHDCIVVPGWGAWMVQYTPAAVKDRSSVIPPRRWLSFNPSLTHNDGMLAHSVMRSEQCSYEEASAYIAQEVTLWQDKLQQDGRVILGRVGQFDRQDSGVPLFTEATDSIVNTSLSLLPVLSLPTLSELLPEAAEPEEDTYQEAPLTWHRRMWQAAISVAAIVILLLSISTPIDNYEASNDYAGMVAAEILGLKAATPTEPASTLQQESSPTDEEPVHAIVETTVYTGSTPSTTRPTEETTEPDDAAIVLPRYILVIGSLPTRSLAEKQISHFRTLGVTEPIRIYEKEGKARLYIEGYDSMAEAQTRLNSLSRDPDRPFEGIWICATR